MARSYLYSGRDSDTLTPAERQLEKLYDQIDRPGNRLTATQFFQTPEASALLDQLFGGLSDRVPPGSQIVSQTPGKITYRDPEGFEHNIVRKSDGQFSTTTNRPAIVNNAGQQAQAGTLDKLRQAVEGGINSNATLAQLDPQTMAALEAITAARRADITQQVDDERGRLVAALYGRGVNRSSIATNAGARFAEGAGRLYGAEASEAANRELSIRNLLTTLNQQNRELNTNLYANLTGQSNQRDIAGAGLDVELKRLAEGGRQFDASNYLEQLRTQIEQQKVDSANSPFNKFLGILNAAGGIAQGVGGGLGAYKALTGGGKK